MYAAKAFMICQLDPKDVQTSCVELSIPRIPSASPECEDFVS